MESWKKSIPGWLLLAFVGSGIGASLGLAEAVPVRIVEEHGGRIAVESKKGEGSTFTITLPIGL